VKVLFFFFKIKKDILKLMGWELIEKHYILNKDAKIEDLKFYYRTITFMLSFLEDCCIKYENEKLGISFLHPKNFFVKEEQTTESLTKLEIQNPKEKGNKITIIIEEVPYLMKLNEYSKINYDLLLNNKLTENIKSKDIKFLDDDAYQMKYELNKADASTK
jgi:hypothetical protein